MTFRQVMVIESDLILGSGVENLLALDDSLEVTAINPDDEISLVRAIWQAHPDVIVLSTSNFIQPMRLLALLESYPRLLRMVVISATENLVRIYDRRYVATTQTRDLARIVQSAA